MYRLGAASRGSSKAGSFQKEADGIRYDGHLRGPEEGRETSVDRWICWEKGKSVWQVWGATAEAW